MDIIDPQTNVSYEKGLTMFYEKKITYTKGSFIKINDWDYYEDKVCSSGIHFFLDKNLALAYRLYDYTWIINEVYKEKQIRLKYNNNFSGIHNEYFDSGKLMVTIEIKDGSIIKLIDYYSNCTRIILLENDNVISIKDV